MSLDLLGCDSTSVGLALWTSREQAKAGIRAARTLQSLYVDVLRDHPDAIKYKSQVDPVIVDADRWDKAWVFYQDSEAVEIGRRAQQLAQQISREYSKPPVVSDPALAEGLAESIQSSAGKVAGAAASTAAEAPAYVKWVVVGALTVAAGTFALPSVIMALRRHR